MLPEKIIEEGSLHLTGSTVRVNVRIPWYRSLPLSCVESAELTLDGQPVPTESLLWTVNGHTRTIGELAQRWEELWHVLDSATLTGELPQHSTSETHEVSVRLGIRIPYLPQGDTVLTIHEKDTKTMTAKEATR